MDEATELSNLFGDIYMHLHPRREPGDYRPSRVSLAVMRHLATIGPLTVGDAAKHLKRSQAATSELINRLINRDLLARQVDQNDRRQHRVWLTEAGRELVADESRPLDPEAVREVLAGLGADDRSEILAGLRTLSRAVRNHAKDKRRQMNDRARL